LVDYEDFEEDVDNFSLVVLRIRPWAHQHAPLHSLSQMELYPEQAQ